jgi:hypothetical protein
VAPRFVPDAGSGIQSRWSERASPGMGLGPSSGGGCGAPSSVGCTHSYLEQNSMRWVVLVMPSTSAVGSGASGVC